MLIIVSTPYQKNNRHNSPTLYSCLTHPARSQSEFHRTVASLFPLLKRTKIGVEGLHYWIRDVRINDASSSFAHQYLLLLPLSSSFLVFACFLVSLGTTPLLLDSLASQPMRKQTLSSFPSPSQAQPQIFGHPCGRFIHKIRDPNFFPY